MAHHFGQKRAGAGGGPTWTRAISLTFWARRPSGRAPARSRRLVLAVSAGLKPAEVAAQHLTARTMKRTTGCGGCEYAQLF
jgi:hypothetical protein